MTPDRFQLIQRVLRQRQPDLTVLAEGVHKTHNIAAIVRSCDAVGVLTCHAVSPGGEIPRHHATNAGASRWSRLRLHNSSESAIDYFHENHHQILAAHPAESAVDYRNVDYCKPTVIVVGNEWGGVSAAVKENADSFVKIPMLGMVASLNVSVATAVVLYEAQRQRQRAGLYDTCRIEENDYQQILFEWSWPHIARRCRERRQPYPELDEDGQMLSNPLTT